MSASPLTNLQKRYANNVKVGGEACSDLRRPTYKYTPEERLWSACLYEAVQTYLCVSSGASPREIAETRSWFAETYAGEVSPPGSYEWICSVLEINPAQFRRRLVQIEQRACGDRRAARMILKGLRKGASLQDQSKEPEA